MLSFYSEVLKSLCTFLFAKTISSCCSCMFCRIYCCGEGFDGYCAKGKIGDSVWRSSSVMVGSWKVIILGSICFFLSDFMVEVQGVRGGFMLRCRISISMGRISLTNYFSDSRSYIIRKTAEQQNFLRLYSKR
jgi:hypothetical protein